MPPTPVKTELGLGDPKPAGSTKQADDFKAAYQAAAAKINEALQYTAAHAEKCKHDPLAAKRDKSCQAYQVALGRIDPTNTSVAQGAIDQVLAAVNELQGAVETFRAAAEKAFNAWTAREGDFHAICDKIREMVDWGHEKAGPLQQVVDAIQKKANDHAYEEALTALEQLLAKANPIYEEYLKQKAAKEEYEPALASLQPRLDTAKQVPYKPLAEMAKELGTAEASMKEKATAKDYVSALGELKTLDGNTTAFEEKVTDLEAKKQEYETARAALDPDLQKASTCQYESLQEFGLAISDLTTKTDEAVKAEDFELAVTSVNELKAKVEEYFAAIEQLKQEYQTARTELDGKLKQVTECKCKDLDAQKQEIVSGVAAIDADVAAQHEDKALEKVKELSTKVDEFLKALEEKKKEYETARAALDPRLAKAKECLTKSLEAKKQELDAGVKPIDDAAAAQDYGAALQAVKDLDAKVTAFETERTAIEDKLKAEINKTFPATKTTLANIGETKSPIKGTAEKLIASIEAALAGTGDLEQAVKDAAEAAKQVAELETVASIRKRLEDKWDINKDDEARKIVAELEASGKLADLPMEARNELVDQLMDGYLSDDDDEAMQKIFSVPAIDRQFEDMDKATREKIVKAYTDNPEMKQIRANWSTMTEDQKKEAIKKLVQIPVGPDGWNVGMPKNFDFTNAPRDANGHILFGSYNYGDDTMSINLHNDGTINSPDPLEKDPIELLDTIAHEMGHKYQRKLIDDLEAGRLNPGDPAYEQARAFQQHEKYKQESPKGFKKIYVNSPKEAHSRVMGTEIRDGLEKAKKTPSTP